VKEFLAFGPHEKWGESKKGERSRVGKGKEGNPCPQTPAARV